MVKFISFSFKMVTVVDLFMANSLEFILINCSISNGIGSIQLPAGQIAFEIVSNCRGKKMLVMIIGI